MDDLEAQPISVMIVDDHEMVRIGLKTALGRSKDVRVTGEAASIAEALAALDRQRPDVLLMDVRLPDGNGIVASRDIQAKFPNTRVLFLTSYTDEEAVMAAVFGGAAGYLLKNISRTDLIEAIKKAASGRWVLDPGITQEVLEHMRDLAQKPPTSEPSITALSAQERKVLALVAEGHSNKEIAVQLKLSEKTVRNYLYRVYKKIHVSRRSQATKLFLQHKLE